MIFLETDRLTLRHFRESDYADFVAYANDIEMSRMMGRGDLSDPQQAMDTFRWLLEREERAYALVLRKTGRVIGNLTVTPVPRELADQPEIRGHRGRSLSFCIGRDYRRQGLMTEAVSAVRDRLFLREDMEFLHCGYFAFNDASRNLQRKLGFTQFYAEHVDLGSEETDAIENVLWRDYFLKTERLTLRRFREEDVTDFFAYISEPELGMWTGLDLTNPTAARRTFDKMKKTPRAYALVLEETGDVVGDLYVGPVPPALQRNKALRDKHGCALSFTTAQPFRRRGIMTEALQGVLQHIFTVEGIDYVSCGYFSFNEPSRLLQEKLGFVPLATHQFHRGSQRTKVIDNVLWRETWEKEAGR